jgi:hypothetical protein
MSDNISIVATVDHGILDLGSQMLETMELSSRSI